MALRWFAIFLSKRTALSRIASLLTFLLIFYVLAYNELARSTSSPVSYTETEENVIQKYKVAVIYAEDLTECSLVEFTKHLVSSFKSTKDFRSTYSLHAFALQKNNQSHKCGFSQSFITNIFVGDQSLPPPIENLVKFIKENGFASVVILQKCEIVSDMWQLAELGKKLSLNLKIYYVLYSTLANPTLETISLVRHMENHATHLIVMTWFHYHSLGHTYGIKENKILHIPHGVSTPSLSKIDTNLQLSKILLKYTDQDLVLLSTDSNENYKRLFHTLELIIPKIPNLHLLIVNKEFAINSTIIPKIPETLRSLQLEDKVTWIDKYTSTEELDVVYKRANAYISISDDILLTPEDLLNAMAYALPIISTPHIFANEILKHNRGLILPYDDKVIAESIIEFLKNSTLMNIVRSNAQEFVRNWTWNNIAKQYTILFETGSFTTIEAAKSFMHALINDPYETEPDLLDTEMPVYWNNSGAISFDGQNVFSCLSRDEAGPGIYTIYADSFLQLNGKINVQYQIEIIGLKTTDQYVVIEKHDGIEDFIMNKQNFTNSFQIDYTNEKIFFQSNNINFEISRSKNEIAIRFLKVNRFTNAFGLMGTTITDKKLFVQNPRAQPIKSLKWVISDQDIFSHFAVGQTLSMYGMEHNIFILPKRTLLQNSSPKPGIIKFQMEGPFFTKGGFPSVNRKMLLALVRNTNYIVSLQASHVTLTQHNVGLDTLIVYSLFLRQTNDTRTYLNAAGQQLTSYQSITIIFRNGWPPDTSNVSNKEILILQQPMEFYAVPKRWVSFIQQKVYDLWVPSEYCKGAFIANGVNASKIRVIPHGIFLQNYQRKLRPLTLSTNKTFKFLTIGGMLARKGLDLLLESYLNLFSSKDDVTLVIHSNYGDGSGSVVMNKLKVNSTAPEILLMRHPLSDVDMIRLLKSADVYVSPYRGEGFGLTILEAMATGLPPIVTKHGPALDFCSEECGYFVEAPFVECMTSHCGKMRIFGSESAVQPMWAEPKIASLSAQMRLAYSDRVQLKKKSEICRKHAEQYTWDKVADEIVKRISEITE